jgi:HSP20 family protein
MSKNQSKQLPVRVYRSENQFALAAPLPGLEPEDITVSIEGNRVRIQCKERGPRQHHLDLLKAEWTVGPYHREIVLPENVDGSLTNATYGNGVLVLTMPKMKTSIGNPTHTEFTLELIGPARGERVGHMGHDIQETTTEKHLELLVHAPRKAAS